MNSKEAAQILGVPQDVKLAELNKAWRTIAKTCHPDLHPGDAEAEIKFRKLNAAYDTLLKIREGRRRQHSLEEDILENEFDRWIRTLDPEKQERIKRNIRDLSKEDDSQ